MHSGVIRLPWPPKALSPNSRKDRRHSTKERQRYKSAGWAAALEAGFRNLKFETVHLRITFNAPDARRRDLDNMLAHIKYALDGISQAIGIDDSRFEYTIRRGEYDRPNGSVDIEIGPPSDQRFIPYRGAINGDEDGR